MATLSAINNEAVSGVSAAKVDMKFEGASRYFVP